MRFEQAIPDLTERAAERWPTALRWSGTRYPVAQTVVLTGNHDCYGRNPELELPIRAGHMKKRG